MTGTALVTGGGRGIGLSMSRALAAEGWRVAALGRSVAHLNALTGEGITPLAADVTDKDGLAAALAELGTVDVLVNNAGVVTDKGPLAEADPQDWWRCLEVNLKGPLLCTQAVLPGMVAAGGGRVINVSSYSANAPSENMSAYATSKAALLRMTDCLDLEVARHGIKVFAISPGWVETDMTAAVAAEFRKKDPTWSGVDPSFVFPPEAAAGLVCRLARGDADALHGRFLHVMDDLDALIADAASIVADDRKALRVVF